VLLLFLSSRGDGSKRATSLAGITSDEMLNGGFEVRELDGLRTLEWK
jgi:hypothetical protein